MGPVLDGRDQFFDIEGFGDECGHASFACRVLLCLEGTRRERHYRQVAAMRQGA